MKKRIFIISPIVIFIALCIFYFSSFRIKENHSCPFCNKKIINYQKYYEDDLILGMYNYRPLVKGHCLIVPKRHISKFEELNDVELNRIFELLRKTNIAVQNICDVNSYMILQKNGRSVGQTVNHVHFHYIPNTKKGSNYSFLFRFVVYPFFGKITKDEMGQMTQLISQNIE